MNIRLNGFKLRDEIPLMRLRIHVEPGRIREIDGEYIEGNDYVDVMCNKEVIKAVLND